MGQGQLVCDMLYYTSLYDTDRWERKMTLGLSMHAFVCVNVRIQCKQSEVEDSGKDCWPPWGRYVCTNHLYTYTHLRTCTHKSVVWLAR